MSCAIHLFVLNCILLVLGMPFSAQAMSCQMVSASEFNFGTYDPLSALPLDVQATYSIQCVPDYPGENLRLKLTFLQNAGQAPSLRNAASGKSMSFGLYLDPELRSPIDAKTQIEVVDRLSTTREYPLTVYGRIPARQNLSSGLYEITMTFVLDY